MVTYSLFTTLILFALSKDGDHSKGPLGIKEAHAAGSADTHPRSGLHLPFQQGSDCGRLQPGVCLSFGSKGVVRSSRESLMLCFHTVCCRNLFVRSDSLVLICQRCLPHEEPAGCAPSTRTKETADSGLIGRRAVRPRRTKQ